MKRRRPRTCVGCGTESPKVELIRVVKFPNGTVAYDPTGRANGRGAYLCKNADCLRLEIKKRGLSRALKIAIPDEVYDTLRSVCEDDNETN